MDNVIGSDEFDGSQRVDIAVSENGISATIRKLHQVAAACQKLDPGVAMSLRGEALRLGESLESVVQGAAVVALQTAVLASPVDTGLLRSNWAVKINKSRPASYFTPETDREGIKTIDEGTAVINTTDREPGQIIWISNSAPHSVACEHGWSGQAPSGMTTLARQAGEQFARNRHIILEAIDNGRRN